MKGIMQRRTTTLIYAISFLDLFAVGLTFPLLFSHIRSLGASHTLTGIIGSTYSALQVLSGPVIGSWSDIRDRKYVLYVTLFLSSTCYLLLASTSSLTFVIILRAVLGCVKHTQTLSKAVIADLYTKEQQSKIHSYSVAYGSIGFIVGPAIGGHLSQLNDGFFYVCCLTATLFIINIGLVYNIPDYSKSSADKDLVTLRNVHKELIKATSDLAKINWKTLGTYFLLRFLYGLTISIFFSNNSLYLQEKYNLSQLHIGYTISFLSIVGTASAFSLGFINKRFYENDTNYIKRLIHGYFVLTMCFIGLFLAPNFITFFLLLLPLSIASTLLRIVSMEVLLSKSSINEKGSLSGVSNSIMSLSRFLSPITAGVITDVFGNSFVLIASFIPALIGTLMSCTLLYNDKIKTKKAL